MTDRRLFVVLNPAAGKGAARRAEAPLRAALAGTEHRVVHSRARGHAAELAEEAARGGWTAVVAVGGDGTVHECANGVLRAGAGTALGVVPVGNGNDFALLAEIPRGPASFARLLAAAPRTVDAGRVAGRWFTNGVGVGLDARVAIEADRTRRLRGIAMYLWALGRTLRTFRPPHMRIEVDGELWADRPMTLATIGNGARHGGGFWICPGARIDDGVLDVCACDALGTLRILRTLPLTLRGGHTGESCVRMGTARRVRITSPDPLPVHADGEIVAEAAHEVEVQIVPGALRIL
jgi:YegS/Rv2252/BmrU family lipid kinase